MSKEPKFRTPWCLGSFNDDEINNEPSMTDPMQDEPIGKVLARLLRGEKVNGHVGSFDEDASFDSVDPTQEDGFDLSDAAVIKSRGVEAVESVKNSRNKGKEPVKVEPTTLPSKDEKPSPKAKVEPSAAVGSAAE